MTELFSRVVFLSLSGILCFPFIMLFRILARRYSRRYSYYAWFVLFAALMLPFRIPVRAAAAIPEVEALQAKYQLRFVENPQVLYEASGRGLFGMKECMAFVWFVVALFLLLKNVYSYIQLKGRLKGAKCIRENFYETGYAISPFVFGIFSPKIYFPTDSAAQNRFIVKHEQVHILHKDYIWLPLVMVLACIHWFNPAVWLGIHIFKADMEMFCDEVVLKGCTQECRQEYAGTLLSIQATCSKGFVTGFNLQKNFLKGRIIQIMTKGHIKYSVGIMVTLVVMAGVLFMVPRLQIQADTKAASLEVPESAAEVPTIVISESEGATENPAAESEVFDMIFPLKVEYQISAAYKGEPDEWGRTHDGIDFAAPKGSEICAVSDGVVSDCGYDTQDGYFVVIAHGEHYKTYYKHCNELFVTQGQTVTQGETIAAVGSTGYSTGAHLHFGVSFDEVMVDVGELLKE